MEQQKKRAVRKPKLAAVLNFIGLMQILAIAGLIIAMIWVNDRAILMRVLMTDCIALVTTLFVYSSECYVPPDKQ
jgi:hypothetical protein